MMLHHVSLPTTREELQASQYVPTNNSQLPPTIIVLYIKLKVLPRLNLVPYTHSRSYRAYK